VARKKSGCLWFRHKKRLNCRRRNPLRDFFSPKTALFKYHKLFIMNAKTTFTSFVYVCSAPPDPRRILLWLITACLVFVIQNLNTTQSRLPSSTRNERERRGEGESPRCQRKIFIIASAVADSFTARGPNLKIDSLHSHKRELLILCVEKVDRGICELKRLGSYTFLPKKLHFWWVWTRKAFFS